MDADKELLNPGNDFVFKLIFGDLRNVDITRDFLSSVLNLSVQELSTLAFTNTEFLREHKTDKKGILDIRVKTLSGMEINIEVQHLQDKTMAERSLYYWAKIFTSNLEKNQTYGQLTKTIAINILHFDFFAYEKYHSIFTIREETENTLLSDLFRIDFLEVLKIKNAKTIPNDKLTQWLKFLSTKDKEALKMLGKENPMIEKAVGILEVLSGDEKVRMEAFYREIEIKDELSRITSAREEGESIGEARGRAEGKAEGKTEGKIEVAKNLLSMGMDIKQVQAVTSLAEEEILKLKSDLN